MPLLRVKETTITTEKVFDRDRFGIKGNHKSNNDEKTLFRVFLQIHNLCFKTLGQRKKYIYVFQALIGF